jgi:hypothetical protein
VGSVFARGSLFELAIGSASPSVSYEASVALTELDTGRAIGRFDQAAPAEVGVLEGVLYAIGRADTKIGGYRITRLLDAVAVGETILPVENCLDWQDSGKIVVGGVVYRYAHRGPGSFHGITHIKNGETIVGVKKAHARNTPIMDLGNPFNAIERVRRAMLVETAESDDLNVVGRNLGVKRYIFPMTDAIYRAAVSTIAYNPRATILGLELALDALVGRENYEIVEDLVRYPCTVWIIFSDSVLKTTTATGHAYLSDTENPLALNDVYDYAPLTRLPPARARGLGARWRPMMFDQSWGDNKRPSELLVVDYDGDTGTTVWRWDGTLVENTAVTPGPDYVTIEDLDNAKNGGYICDLRSDQTGVNDKFSLLCRFMIDSSSTLTSQAHQWMGRVQDGIRNIGWGVASGYLGLTSGGNLIGTGTAIALDTWYEVQLERKGNMIRLWINGALTEERDLTEFATNAPTTAYALIGCYSTTVDDIKVLVAQVAVNHVCATDLASIRGTMDLSTVGGAYYNIELTSGDKFDSGDLGHNIRIFNSAVNAYGGNSDGTYRISRVVSDVLVEVTGKDVEIAGANVSTDHPTRVTIPANINVFRFPDDLGKQLILSESALGNDGVYVIKDLLQIDTLKNLATDFDTPIPECTNVCEVEAATFVTEPSLVYRVDPNFDTETVDGMLDQAADYIEDPDPRLSFRQDLVALHAHSNKAMEVLYSQVLSAQVLLDSDVLISALGTDPETYDYYPFYLTDALSFIRGYLDELTAAGVIAEYLTR